MVCAHGGASLSWEEERGSDTFWMWVNLGSISRETQGSRGRRRTMSSTHRKVRTRYVCRDGMEAGSCPGPGGQRWGLLLVGTGFLLG